MLAVISPAKTLDFDTQTEHQLVTQPEFLDQSQVLIDELRDLAPQDISTLMKISDKLGQLNYARFQSFEPPFTQDNARPCVLAFKGDVYTGLAADTLSENELAFAQDHLRILSGLYGLLRPMDLMQAYRLEMGTKFANSRGKDLYQFWDDKITQALQTEIDAQGESVLINLASNEYFKAVKTKQLKARVITPVFKDTKNGKLKIISFYAKKARGLMVSYMIRNQLTEPEQLKTFDTDGYRYNESMSTENEWIFTRDEQV